MEPNKSEIVMDPVHETTCLKCHHLMDVSGLPAFSQIACPECGTQQHVPAKMGAFLLVDLLGKGGMGAVYRGRDTGLDRWVAVKVMQSSFGGNPEFVETFRREAQAAAALTHPNIVQIYSFGVSYGQPYMVMELLEGGRLDQMISRGELLNEALIMKIGADVAEGLSAAAAINLIHGDVKPENILMDNNGVAKVVDFGLARFKERGDGTATKGIWGTPYYIAPEKLRGHQSDARSDIYSLGGTLFHALTLKPPFDGETPMDVVKARLKKPAPPLRMYRQGVNPEVEAIVGRMLEADPLKRYPNYASVLADIRRVLSTMKIPVSQSFAQPSKKSGKIVLAKKKGGGPITSSGMPLGAAPTDHGIPPKKPSGGGKVFLWVMLTVCVLIGLIGGGIAFMQARQRDTEEARERAKVVKYRQNAEQIWNNVQAALVDVSNRHARVQSWSNTAAAVTSMISTGVVNLTSPGDWAGAETNARASAFVITQYATGILSSVTSKLGELADQVGSNRQAMLTVSNVAPVYRHWMLITNAPGRSSELIQSLAPGTDKAQKAADSLDGLKKKFNEAIKASIDAAEKAAAEKAAAEKIEAERLAQEKAAAEKAARIQSEIKSIEVCRKASNTLIQQHEFKSVLTAVQQLAKGLQTDEGKAAGRYAVKAYQMMVEMKALFVDGIKAEVKADPDKGYSYGWLKNTDILGATDEKLTLRGGQAVAWSAVPPRQMMLFVQHYILDSSDLTAREKAQHEFAVALYIYDSMGGLEKAKAQVAKYLSEALRGNSGLADMAKSLMPDIETK